MTRFRMLFAFSILAVLATALVACGSSSSESPQDVIKQTFGSGHDKLTSADLNLTLKADVTGSGAGTVDATLNGPFESQGATKVPKLDLNLKYDAKTQSGKSTSFEVLQLQRDLTAARSSEIRALADYNIALSRLALDVGVALVLEVRQQILRIADSELLEQRAGALLALALIRPLFR